MKKITLNEQLNYNFLKVFKMVTTSQAAKGVADITLRNYDYHMRNIARYLDVDRPFEEVSKRDVENMMVAMRTAGLSHNSIAAYIRMLKAFYHWCSEEKLPSIRIPSIKEKETVKETYTDDERKLLLRRPDKGCSFSEFWSWVLVNFLMNFGCRAATARGIQNKDVDLEGMRVVFRRNKNGKIQVISLEAGESSLFPFWMFVILILRGR